MVDLFSEEFETMRQQTADYEKRLQDDLAEMSPVFRKIMEHERALYQREFVNTPESLTRNAMLTRTCYPTFEEWEASLASMDSFPDDRFHITERATRLHGSRLDPA